MPVAIRIENLNKTFISKTQGKKKIKAIDNINLDIYEGEILGILGPNGAGKTTLLNILSTLLIADSGTVEILGIKADFKNFNRIRSILNMSSGYPNFAWCLTIEENLKFYGRLYGLKGKQLQQKVDKLIEMFVLREYAKQRFDELSSGTKQRMALAKALINDPKIIFLDEPTIGLDPDVAIKTREIVLDVFHRSKITVLFTTHNMHEVEQVCQRVAFIRQGRLIKVSTPKELKLTSGKNDLEQVFIELAHETVDERKIQDVGRGTKEVGREQTMQRPNDPTDSMTQRLINWFYRCYAFTVRNTLFAVRNVFTFMELFFWPFVTLISIGLMGDFLKLQDQAFAFIMTGAITAGVLQVSQLDVAYNILYEVWSKSVKQTFLTPVGMTESLFGSWITGIIRGIAVFIILGSAAVFMFGFKFPSLLITTIFLFGIFCCALLLGLIVTVLILVFGQKAEITAWMFAYIFMMLCGIYYPIDTLPVFFKYCAQLVPITYFLEYFRQSFGFQTQFSHVLLKGFGLCLIYLYVGISAMRFAFKRGRQNGTIVRLSE